MRLKSDLTYILSFNYIAISVTAWSFSYVQELLNLLGSYQGKVILGGYEITAMNQEQLDLAFPRADYFIQGYAEESLRGILEGKQGSDNRLLTDGTSAHNYTSPYLSHILPLYSKKIYWETKRGCPHRCGFCEWGNAQKEVWEIDKNILLREIELFTKSGIQEINILDGTFNHGKSFTGILEHLMNHTDMRITCQARFDTFASDQQAGFRNLCHKYRDRIYLEFGLQSIHEKEKQEIGRSGNLLSVKKALRQLDDLQIKYLTSIIYGIPGQTIESFIETIEFLRIHQCANIAAYPLRIPKNSKMFERKESLFVKERPDVEHNTVKVVGSSYSFLQENWEDMKQFADDLRLNTWPDTVRENTERLFKEGKLRGVKTNAIDFVPETISEGFANHINRNFIVPTLSRISRISALQGFKYRGELMQYSSNKDSWHSFIRDLVLGEYVFRVPVQNHEPATFEYSFLGKKVIVQMKSIDKEYQCKCRVKLGRSGALYVYREVS